MEDQCHRLMGSLEEARRTIEMLTAEKDHYKEFWQAMSNYHSVMSRFRVPAATVPQLSFPYNAPPQSAQNPVMGNGFPIYNMQAFPTTGTGPPLRAPSQPHEHDLIPQPGPPLPHTLQQNSGAVTAVSKEPIHLAEASPPSASAQPQNVPPPPVTSPSAVSKILETPKKEASKPIDAYFSKSLATRANAMDTTTGSNANETSQTDAEITPKRQPTKQNDMEDQPRESAHGNTPKMQNDFGGGKKNPTDGDDQMNDWLLQ